MASPKAIDRLYKNVRRAAERDSTLPVLDKQYVERWVSRLSDWQLDALNRRTAPVDFKKDGDLWSALITKVVRFNEDNDNFDATLGIVLDNLALEDNPHERCLWLASDPSDPNPVIQKMKMIYKAVPSSSKQPSSTDPFHQEHLNGIYAPLPKFVIWHLSTHWILIHIAMKNIPPHSPDAQRLARTLNSVTEGSSPLATLHTYLGTLVANEHRTDWLGVTNFALEHFRSKVGSLSTLPPGSKIRIFMDLIPWDFPAHVEACQHPWFSSDVVAQLILALALPAHKLSTLRDRPDNAPNPTLKAHLFNDLLEAELTPSASLRKAFQYAKAAACGPQARTTVVMVAMVDTEDWRLRDYPDAGVQDAKKQAREYLVLSHFFTLGVEPEGMRMWQSWKYLGPRLEEHISMGGAKVRGWTEAEEFVDAFEELVTRDVGQVRRAESVARTCANGGRRLTRSRTSCSGRCLVWMSWRFLSTIQRCAVGRFCLGSCHGWRFVWWRMSRRAT